MIELTNKYGEPLSQKEIDRQIAEEKRQRKMLIIRNWLNGIFILLALVAIVGIGFWWFNHNETLYYYSCGIAVVAVIIKMAEALFRMPGFANKF
ncbi:MAG: hypothetical protein Q4D23_03650 [Bacteroidales bacterium]|nr:hypothetical protein [Bacteroidales bacterium]